MRYPLSVMKTESNSSSPSIDWEALEGVAAGEMVSLHPAATNLETHNTPTPGSPGYKPPSPPSVWGPARGAADGKWLFGQAAFGSTSHHPGSPGAEAVPAPGWEGDGWDLTWGLRGVGELLWSLELGRACLQSFPWRQEMENNTHL